MAYTGSNPHYQASGWTEIRGVKCLRETPKSWQVELPTGQTPYVPKSQFEIMTTSPLIAMNVGAVVDIKVKTWLTHKWDLETKYIAAHGMPTFEFDLASNPFPTAIETTEKTPDDSFLLDYSKKQLIAACTAYRSTIQQMTAAIESYHPELVTRLARGDKILDGRACSPDPKGMFPMVTQTWDNQANLREIGRQGDAVLKSMYIGQAMLEKMGAIESLLLEKRAEVAADLIASMDDDEE